METWVASLDREDPLEEGMATHSSILAWRISWTEKPAGLQSMGSRRAGYTERLTLSFILDFQAQCGGCYCYAVLSHFRYVRLFAAPWIVVCQSPPSMAFSRPGYWSGLPFPSPGDLLDPGSETGSPALQAGSLPEPPGKHDIANVLKELYT